MVVFNYEYFNFIRVNYFDEKWSRKFKKRVGFYEYVKEYFREVVFDFINNKREF